ncbi:hypothetical protein CMV_003324 [Castanea mollissima]|uniref:Uncharacterized protein n=1 Tax=Castanea mollissima TaxID=60419 RepID=A0A8J4VWB1_9ROSI|nr:hypothetical protein CMV_003324 [Castanea mollissima]
MASFSCLGLWVFVPLCSLSVTFTGQSSVNSGLIGLVENSTWDVANPVVVLNPSVRLRKISFSFWQNTMAERHS